MRRRQASMKDNYSRIDHQGQPPIHQYQLDWNNTRSNQMPNIIRQVSIHEDDLMEQGLLSIKLSVNKLGDSGCEHLSRTNWANLYQLQLEASNAISHKGIQQLSKANWPKLEKLNLWFNKIGSTGCQHLIRINCNQLKHLDIAINNIGNEGCRYIVSSLWNLQVVNLSENKISKTGCQHLARSKWSNLTILKLHSNPIGDDGAKQLSKAIQWQALQEVYLNDSHIQAKGCRYLSKNIWKSLKIFNLCNNDIQDTGCLHLSKGHWSSLTILEIKFNNIREKGAINLTKHQFKGLDALNLFYNKIKKYGFECLKECAKRMLSQEMMPQP